MNPSVQVKLEAVKSTPATLTLKPVSATSDVPVGASAASLAVGLTRRGSRIGDLVYQEFWGLLLYHWRYAISCTKELVDSSLWGS